MTGHRKIALLLLRCSWLALLAWQPVWHSLLPPPAGSGNLTLAMIALAPLLPFTPGVLRAGQYGLMFGMFLVMGYFIVGLMETWSNAEQRVAALLQTVLCCIYFAGLVLVNRPARLRQD